MPTKTARRIATSAEIIATLTLALWIGGLIALGAFAAPTIFGKLDRETAGTVMGTIFAKFDRMVIVLIAVFAVAEVTRVAVEGTRGLLGRIRIAMAVVLITSACLTALWLGPSINELFAEGTRRGIGEAGRDMDRLHELASTLGKVAAVCAAVWFALGIISRRARS